MDNFKPLQYLNNDTCRCTNSKCPLKNNCARWLQSELDKFTDNKYLPYSYFNFEYINNEYSCKYQIKIK